MNPQDQNLDATSVFGVQKPMSNTQEMFHRELERRSLDIIRVKNPDNKDFFIEWDKRYWRVPAQGTLDVPRYIAIKYCKDKAVDTINHTADKLHETDIVNREKSGLPPFESKWHEQQATYVKSNYPRTNDKSLLTKLYSEYWVGLVYEYGKDNPMQTQSEPETLDMTPIELKIIKEMENRRVDVVEQAPVKEEKTFTGFQSPTAQAEPVFIPKEKMVDEVSLPDDKNAESNDTP